MSPTSDPRLGLGVLAQKHLEGMKQRWDKILCCCKSMNHGGVGVENAWESIHRAPTGNPSTVAQHCAMYLEAHPGDKSIASPYTEHTASLLMCTPGKCHQVPLI